MHEAFTSSTSLAGNVFISFIYHSWLTYPDMLGDKAGGESNEQILYRYPEDRPQER